MPPPSTTASRPTSETKEPSIDARYIADALLEALGQRPHQRMYPYFLGVNRLGTAKLLANQAVADQAPVGGDAAFLAVGLIGQGTGDFLLTLKWSHLSGQAFAQIGLHSKALFGADWRPFQFPRPQLMPHDSTLTLELVNLTDVDNQVAVYVYGFKVMR
jgi:hypothetical protein